MIYSLPAYTKFCLYLLFISLTINNSLAQENNSKEVDVDFLFNYYNQDGDHAAVTGGSGTEELSDRAMEIEVNIPLDSISTVFFSTHLNVYSSASTDNIDNRVSSASKEDVRAAFEIGYSRNMPLKNQSYGLNAGGSSETDYLSAYLKGDWTISSSNNNSELAISTQAYFDTWLPIFPYEIRGTDNALITTNKRNSFALSIALSQVLGKKVQAAFLTDLVYQTGLLSTPFHRVYFKNYLTPKIEKFPNRRWKYPLGIRINYFVNDYFISRFYFRYYHDSFDIDSYTTELEVPIKIGRYFSFSPFYRFYTQSKANFFAPYKAHGLDKSYYTSDYDLSAFNSHKIGIGVSYSPLYGISRFKLSKTKLSLLDHINLRAAHYQRSDGLHAFLISVNCSFKIRSDIQ